MAAQAMMATLKKPRECDAAVQKMSKMSFWDARRKKAEI